jgi:hypothetical protein
VDLDVRRPPEGGDDHANKEGCDAIAAAIYAVLPAIYAVLPASIAN